MRRPFIFGGILLFAVLVVVSLFFFSPPSDYEDIPTANILRINEGERSWYESNTLDYDISVQISFSTELRISELEVRGGVVTSAREARWDESSGGWGPFAQLEEESYRFYTIPGLFTTLRRDLQNEDVQREEYRFSFDLDHNIPDRIFLGNIIQEGGPVEGTALLIEVVSFRRLE